MLLKVLKKPLHKLSYTVRQKGGICVYCILFCNSEAQIKYDYEDKKNTNPISRNVGTFNKTQYKLKSVM